LSHGPQSFRKNDVKRACQAVMAAGLHVARVLVDTKNGQITVLPGKRLEDEPPTGNEWDSVA
jgi:hypothetical protein